MEPKNETIKRRVWEDKSLKIWNTELPGKPGDVTRLHVLKEKLSPGVDRTWADLWGKGESE